jgi:hypothetical protein
VCVQFSFTGTLPISLLVEISVVLLHPVILRLIATRLILEPGKVPLSGVLREL